MPISAMAATTLRVDLGSGLRSTRPGDGTVPGEVGEPAERHLRSPGIVDAQEQDGRELLRGVILGLDESFEPLSANLSAPTTNQSVMVALAAKLLEAVEHERLDRLLPEHTLELGVEISRHGVRAFLWPGFI